MTMNKQMNQPVDDRIIAEAEALRALVASRNPIRESVGEPAAWRVAPRQFAPSTWAGPRTS